MDKQPRKSGKNKRRRNKDRKPHSTALDQAPHFDPEKLLSLASAAIWNTVHDASVIAGEGGETNVAFLDTHGQEIKCSLAPEEAALLADSGAITPRMSPWPNSLLSLALCTAWP